ncbi:hypothetical protein N9Y67_02695 [Pseudomonadota bacterium]|nr:hypothetical protein [Pseudomonadota bacterium]
MKQASKYILILALLIPAISNAGIMDFFKSGTSEELQHDFDIVHLKDVATLSGYIATKQQEQYAEGGPPYQHKRTSAKDFIVELQSKLGNEIEIPFDLQKVPVNKPNFYIYMVVGNAYFLAVHVHHNYSFANKVADYYYKVEVTNNQNVNRKGTWLREELLANESYKKAIAAKPNKPGYPEKLREKLGGNNAF